MTPRERLYARLRDLVLGPDVVEVSRHTGHAMAGFLSAMGGVAPVTDYDRHRQRFEETGDEEELERMLRHVGPS